MEISDLIYIDDTGYHYPDYPTIQSLLTQKYKDIYGADIYLEADSQDGQWIAVQAKAIYDTAALGASVYNSMSPATAQGAGLSRNVKINGLTRQPATRSSVDLTIVGVVGTQINNGIAQDNLNQKWDLPVSVLIPITGTITVTAMAQEDGNVNAEAATITKIFTPTLGWQTVNNVSAATPGRDVETDAALRSRQAVSTANPSLTVFDGTIGAVENLTGVTQIRGYENDTGSTDGNGIPAHTISVVVEGGDDMEIAQTIQIHKTPGVGTYGTTSEIVQDSHGMPLTINFYRPTDVTIGVEITLVALDGWTTDFETQISAAVADFINNIGIGNAVQLTKIYPPAYLVGTPAYQTFDITLIRIKKNAGAFGTSNIAIAFNELAGCDPLVNVSYIVT